MTSLPYSDPFAQPESSGGSEALQNSNSLEPERTAYGDSGNPPAHSDDDFEHGEHSDDYDNYGNSAQPEGDDTETPNNSNSQNDYVHVVELMNSETYTHDQKLEFLENHATSQLNKWYDAHMTSLGFQRITMAHTIPSATDHVTEDTYLPLDPDNEASVDPQAPPPLYPAYTGYFQSAQAARTYRKRTRVAPKSNASDIDRVKRYGRVYWVRRIYEAMIDISNITDGESSIHRVRFADDTAFDPLDLEAAAHHVFDSALAVHERGWNRPLVYHKRVVRGKLTDVSEKCLERRLARLCLCLKHKKATVDDALRGGVTLALLCDNPEARGFTKVSNNTGNKKRGERLRRAKGSKMQQEPDEDE